MTTVTRAILIWSFVAGVIGGFVGYGIGITVEQDDIYSKGYYEGFTDGYLFQDEPRDFGYVGP